MMVDGRKPENVVSDRKYDDRFTKSSLYASACSFGGYLKHAACLAEAAENENFKNAMTDLQVALENIFKIPFYERLPGLCCGLKRFQSDIDRNTEQNCGAEAVAMTKYILNMLTTEIPDVICQRYDPASDECQKILPAPGTPGGPSEGKSQLGRLLDTMFGNK